MSIVSTAPMAMPAGPMRETKPLISPTVAAIERADRHCVEAEVPLQDPEPGLHDQRQGQSSDDAVDDGADQAHPP
jgi:hypothetical protein